MNSIAIIAAVLLLATAYGLWIAQEPEESTKELTLDI
jgi:hypothetical protein